jgi:Cu2+-exporting ATPase
MAHEMGHGPGMDAKGMARDMRNRFWVCLAFTVPIFLYAPMGMDFIKLKPPFGLDLGLWLFLLATAAVIYPAWPFFVAAARALRNGVLNMAVLVVLSVGTGYVFSVGSTFIFGGAQFYEAVSVLLVFILLGHWLEMRARRSVGSHPRADGFGPAKGHCLARRQGSDCGDRRSAARRHRPGASWRQDSG